MWTACAGPRDPVGPGGAPRGSALYQYSVIDALLAGVFDGDLTCGALKRHGDFGIGAFNQLDGELVLYQGVAYRIRFDGSVHEVSDDQRVPNAFATVFAPTQTIALPAGATLQDLQAELARRLRPSAAYAIEVRGPFAAMTARAPEPAKPPYPELAAHLAAHPHTFELTATHGVGIGFWLPAYLARVNIPGLHLHYLADDHKRGGHVLGFRGDGRLEVRVMELSGVNIELSRRPELDQIDLRRDRQRDTQRVETGDRRPAGE